jgi:hypothetical protein
MKLKNYKNNIDNMLKYNTEGLFELSAKKRYIHKQCKKMKKENNKYECKPILLKKNTFKIKGNKIIELKGNDRRKHSI